MKKVIMTIILIHISLLCINCTKSQITKFEISDYGIISAQHVEQKVSTSNPPHKENISINPKVIKRTTEIPAILGEGFGYIYVIKGEPKGKLIPITIAYRVPEQKNPETGKIYSTFELKFDREIGSEYHTAYRFDEEWELVPGKWSIEIFYRGKKVLEKTFNIYNP
jgi:hypothetical protein